VSVLMMVFPSPTVVVPVGHHTGKVMFTDGLVKLHSEFLVNDPDIFAGVGVDFVEVLSGLFGTEESHVVPSVAFHDVLFHPQVFLSVVGD